MHRQPHRVISMGITQWIFTLDNSYGTRTAPIMASTTPIQLGQPGSGSWRFLRPKLFDADSWSTIQY